MRSDRYYLGRSRNSMSGELNIRTLRRRARIVLALIVCISAISACSRDTQDDGRIITLAKSFVTDAKLSDEQHLPIVVFVSQYGCQFCALLREQVLYPMIRAGELEDKAILREVSLDVGFNIEGFDGAEIAGRNFADRYAAVVTPTLIFLDATGTEIADKLVGIGNIEYYPFYLNRNLESARSKLKLSP